VRNLVTKIFQNTSVLASAALLTAGLAMGAPQDDTKSVKPDNTKVNKQDRDKMQPTADQAKNGKSDREIMQNIRRAVVGDKSLSTYAHNVKIIAKNGKVTLKGPVHTADEKKTVESKAAEVAGEGNVSSQITVKGDSK
jgi:hyperosmotically inducible protein